MNYIAITLSLINICLLFVFLFKFKSLFTTDDIVEKTKQKINQIVGDVNQNAQRDIDLINHCQRQMRTLLKESEEKMQEFQQATNLLRDMLAEIDRQGVNKNIQYTQKNNANYNKKRKIWEFEAEIEQLPIIDNIKKDDKIRIGV